MKKVALIFTFAFLMLAIPSMIYLDYQTSAGGGCCMERDSQSSHNWYENGLSFRKCREENQKRDGDDLYQRTGSIYWEQNC